MCANCFASFILSVKCDPCNLLVLLRWLNLQRAGWQGGTCLSAGFGIFSALKHYSQRKYLLPFYAMWQNNWTTKLQAAARLLKPLPINLLCREDCFHVDERKGPPVRLVHPSSRGSYKCMPLCHRQLLGFRVVIVRFIFGSSLVSMGRKHAPANLPHLSSCLQGTGQWVIIYNCKCLVQPSVRANMSAPTPMRGFHGPVLRLGPGSKVEAGCKCASSSRAKN